MNSWITLAVVLAGITQCIHAEVEVVISSSDTCGSDYPSRNGECYLNSDSTKKLPNLSLITSYARVVSLFEGSSYNVTYICSQDLTVLKTISSCLVNSYRRCADNDFKTLIPTADQYTSAIDYACNNKVVLQSIADCFKTTASTSILDCTLNIEARKSLTDGHKPERSNEFSEATEYHCGRRNIDLECKKIDEDFKACSNQDYNIYEELMNKIKPEACNGVDGLVYTTSLLLVAVFSFLQKCF